MNRIPPYILAIDPGTTQSAYVLLDAQTLRPIETDILPNERLLSKITRNGDNGFPVSCCDTAFIIEMVASYGMAVGKEVFETVFWIGRFWQAATLYAYRDRIYRQEEKITLCHDSRAKDANVRQALIDRFGVVGTKKNPGWFYGVKKDMWAAIAVGVTWADKQNMRKENHHDARTET